MFNHHYEMIVIQKQNEIKQYAKEAWKLSFPKEENMIQKIRNLIKVNHPAIKSSSKLESCKVC